MATKIKIVLYLLLLSAANKSIAQNIPYQFLNLPTEERTVYFDSLYQNLTDPYRNLEKKERAREVYLNEITANLLNPLYIKNLEKVLVYFDQFSRHPYKTIKTKEVEIQESLIDGLKLRWVIMLENSRQVSFLECYDRFGRLIIVVNFRVMYDDVSAVKNFNLENWEGILGSSETMYAFKYDNKGNIIKASQYYSPDGYVGGSVSLGQACVYQDYTQKILSNAAFRPMPFYVPAESEIVYDSDKKELQTFDLTTCAHSHICCDVGCGCCKQFKLPVQKP